MASLAAEDLLHESTTPTPTDIRHQNPLDATSSQVWLFEPSPSNGVLTQDGLSRIQAHRYKSGAYTYLDNLLNPLWTGLTEMLPLRMAPNLVTLMGGLHCAAAYALTWRYAPRLDEPVPDWLLLFNAYCTMAYYTLDCMDGKQARRTNSSSPLGQLFDHGMDCLCLLAHLSTVHICIGDGPKISFWSTQAALMFPFFCAQWEEYHTGVLPHATGNIGVTEVNYGQALFSLSNAFINREELYTDELVRILAIGWVGSMTLLTVLSISRVMSSRKTAKARLSALSKLISPLLLAVSPFLVPPAVRETEFRFLHLATGLGLVLCTIKIVVFSMARQAYASIQGDAIPCLLVFWWIGHDTRLTADGVGLVLRILTFVYVMRIIYWAHAFIRQVCERLNIRLLTVTNVNADKKTA